MTDRPPVVTSRRDPTQPTTPAEAAPRVIAVGVRDHEYDEAALRFAIAEARAGRDSLHVVHSYLPVRLDGCSWEPVQRARDARYVAGRRAVAQAVQRVREAAPGLAVDGSAVAGLPSDVLDEISAFVDLLVIGDDSAAPPGRVSGARTTWWAQDAARCPVVSVPPGRAVWSGRPVTVVLSEHGSTETVRFAADWAEAHRAMLRISQPAEVTAVPESAAVLAASQEDLDIQACEWQRRCPGLGVVARIERDPQWLASVAARSSVLVVSARDAALVRRSGVVLRCPTITVPAHPTSGPGR
ncbi:MAG: universal stress protein, partial [Actinobacteria bacterium]|nr:universal stress protein [Actinomycetota bacterium]